MTEPKPTAPNEPPRSGLQPPQFRLSTLLLLIAALAGLFAAMNAAGPIGAFSLLLFVLAVVAHVMGNSIGTRLRDIGNAPADKDEAAARSPRGRKLHGSEFAPTTSLRRRTSVTRTMLALAISGSVLGAAAGTGALLWFQRGISNIPTLLLAIISSAVLGGLLGFAASSMIATASGAWRQAERS